MDLLMGELLDGHRQSGYLQGANSQLIGYKFPQAVHRPVGMGISFQGVVFVEVFPDIARCPFLYVYAFCCG